MSDKAVDDCLSALQFVLDWFVSSKMVEKFCRVLFAKDDIVFFDKGFGSVTFPEVEMGILSLDLDKIYFDDVNFYENDPETIIHVRLLAWHNKFEQCKTF